jgi:hypothetical protein
MKLGRSIRHEYVDVHRGSRPCPESASIAAWQSRIGSGSPFLAASIIARATSIVAWSLRSLRPSGLEGFDEIADLVRPEVIALIF